VAAEAAAVAAPPPPLPVQTRHPALGVAAVLVGAMIAGLNLRLTSFGLADIRGGMGLSFDEGAWFATCFNAAQMLLAPPVAYLARGLGARRVLLPASLVYGVVTALLPFAPTVTVAIGMQVLRGAAAGTFLPAVLTFVMQALPPASRIWGIAAYAFCVIFSNNVSASLEGFYGDAGAWRWVFWQTAVLAAPMALMVRLGMPLQPLRFDLLRQSDWGGLLLCGTGLALLYAGMDQGNRLDWTGSGTVVGLLLAGALLLAAFVVNELVRPDPWVRFSILGRRSALVAGGVLGLFITSTLAGLIVLPSYMNNVLGLRSLQVGQALAWAAVPQLLVIPATVWLLRRGADPRLLIGTGLALLAVSAWMCTGLTHDWAARDFLPAIALQGIGQSMAIICLIVAGFSSVGGPDEVPTFAAWIQVARLMGAEAGAAALNTWLRVREQHASHLVGQHVTPWSWKTQAAIAQFSEAAAAHDHAASHGRGVARLATLLRQEATVIACLDAFWLIAWLSILALLLLALMPPVPRRVV
jgi:MFS transporter, DHA2 family, multidrug resistance protein